MGTVMGTIGTISVSVDCNFLEDLDIPTGAVFFTYTNILLDDSCLIFNRLKSSVK